MARRICMGRTIAGAQCRRRVQSYSGELHCAQHRQRRPSNDQSEQLQNENGTGLERTQRKQSPGFEVVIYRSNSFHGPPHPQLSSSASERSGSTDDGNNAPPTDTFQVYDEYEHSTPKPREAIRIYEESDNSSPRDLDSENSDHSSSTNITKIKSEQFGQSSTSSSASRRREGLAEIDKPNSSNAVRVSQKGLHSIEHMIKESGFHPDNEEAIREVQRTPYYTGGIYIAKSEGEQNGRVRVKVGQTRRNQTRRGKEQKRCGLTFCWLQQVVNPYRVEKYVLNLLDSIHEVESRGTSLSYSGGVIERGRKIPCKCGKKHHDVFLTVNNDLDWLKKLIMWCVQLDLKEFSQSTFVPKSPTDYLASYLKGKNRDAPVTRSLERQKQQQEKGKEKQRDWVRDRVRDTRLRRLELGEAGSSRWPARAS
ncbi:hypothetical protein BDZ91DRAFT_751943 [Kalaharituber pfeilii]|nr:hypothetical protein BDZ91DRAFT_751943 [Kalaharituber pfeilii]